MRFTGHDYQNGNSSYCKFNRKDYEEKMFKYNLEL